MEWGKTNALFFQRLIIKVSHHLYLIVRSVSAPVFIPSEAWGSHRRLVPLLLVHVVMTAIKNYQMSFLTFELCTPLPCIVLHLHYRLRESILCSVTSRCETYSLIKKDIYCSQTRSTLTLLNSKTNRCKIHTVVKKTKKKRVGHFELERVFFPSAADSSVEKKFQVVGQSSDCDRPVVLRWIQSCSASSQVFFREFYGHRTGQPLHHTSNQFIEILLNFAIAWLVTSCMASLIIVLQTVAGNVVSRLSSDFLPRTSVCTVCQLITYDNMTQRRRNVEFPVNKGLSLWCNITQHVEV